MQLDIAKEAAGYLLCANALGQLAGAQVERINLDAVLLLERFDDVVEIGGAVGRVVDDELTFFLTGNDDLVPIVRLRGCADGKAPEGEQNRKNPNHRHTPRVSYSIVILRPRGVL